MSRHHRRGAVICLHSSASSSRQFAGLAEAPGAGYRVEALDLAGYGAQAPWPAGEFLDLAGEAARVQPLIDAQDGPCHLVGHSYGAAVAVRLALANPGRFASMALYEPTLFSAPRAAGRRPCETDEVLAVAAAVDALLARGRTLGAARRFVSYWAGEATWRRLDDAQRERLARRAHKARSDFHALFTAGIDEADLAALSMPVLCLHGTRTRLSALGVAKCFARAVPHIRSVALAGAGHMAPLTHAHAVNGLWRAFIERHTDGRVVSLNKDQPFDAADRMALARSA